MEFKFRLEMRLLEDGSMAIDFDNPGDLSTLEIAGALGLLQLQVYGGLGQEDKNDGTENPE